MNNQSHQRIQDGIGCDYAVTDRTLVVNCTGIASLSEPFSTNKSNGRKDYYLMVMAQGEMEFYLPGGKRILRAGEMIIFPPGYSYRYVKLDYGEMFYYWVHFTGSDASKLLRDCHISPMTPYEVGLSEEIPHAFRRMFQEFIRADEYYESAAAACLVLLFSQLGREIAGLNTRISGNRVHRSLLYMHRHYSAPLSISSLASMEHLSVSRFSAVFKQSVGMSPQNYLIDLRLKAAVRLMRETDLGIRQIAQTVGYEDALYFSRLFKSRMGIPPAKFSESLQSGQ